MNEGYTCVVIGSGSYNDLGLIRSLGEKGIRSIYLTDGEHVIPIRKSKYLLGTVITDWGNGIATSLRKIYEKYKTKLILFPASDKAAEELDKHYQTLSSFAITPNVQGRMKQFMDKQVQASVAAKSGFSVPASVSFNLEKDTVTYSDIQLPCIVKPLLSIKGSKAHITVCRSSQDLSDCIRLYKDNHEYQILIQDYIEQEGQKEICITGVSLPHHQIILGGIIEKYRTIDNGSTSYGKVHTQVEAHIAQKVAKLMELIPYTGIFDIECFSSPGKEPTFIECNFRNGAYGYAVSRAGINLPWLFYAHSAGIPIGTTTTRDLVFMEERSDFLHVTRKEISLLQWLRNLCHTDAFLFSNRKDVGPMIRVPHFVRKNIPWL